MAYYRSNGFTEYPDNPANTSGKKHKLVFFEATIAAASNEDNDVWILSGPHGFDDKIAAIVGSTPAFTAATNNDLGFYYKDHNGDFQVLDDDILWDGVSLATGLSYRELLGTLNTSLDRDDNIGKLLGKTSEQEPLSGVYLGLKMRTASAATSEKLVLMIVIEEANTK